ncbi:MAG: TRAP transporter fused permease subunit [Betaproteobacteria bacterium]|nr:MAG: TRAP transporter fused permease subunit [Betaproteobacteria bacterium]TMH34762.1 MAG: TRAP transporter fused permease subunit [Betaproteobacteria bacterium]
MIGVEPVVTEQQLKKAEEFIAAEEGAHHRFAGAWGHFLFAVAVAMSVYHLYAAYGIVTTTTLRYVHVGFTLFLVFLLFPATRRLRHRFSIVDLVCAIAGVVTIAYALAGGDDFLDRGTAPTLTDNVMGIVLVLLVLEAARRSTGWVMPLVCVLFIVYAMAGSQLPPPWTHRGYDIGRLVGTMYMTLEGIFGSPVDVSSSLIILFTIFGAVLQFSNAGQFFIDFSLAAFGGRATGAGRAVTAASFLLGGPSGSGVATTVTLGTVAYPMLAKAGYGKNAAGGLLAAGGLGAILSPPVLGAAAFLIAEFLKISYLDVIRMATIPTCLYYFSLFLMVEIDARKLGMKRIEIAPGAGVWQLTKTMGFHFSSLVSIIVFLLIGYSPIASVFWSTVVAFLVSFLNRDCALLDLSLFTARPPGWGWLLLRRSKLMLALEAGSVGMLNVAATCAAAGLIVGVVTLTGLGLRFADIVITYAGGSLVLTAIYAALIVWVVGLAVPVTASYIICAVVAAPALIKLGVPDFAAHMFIFYYAVLSEVSPPTALSPFAAAAITGGDPYKTTLQSWKYTLPAFIVPFIFVLDPLGVGLLLALPKGGSWGDVVWVTVLAMLALVALAAAAEGWLFEKTSIIERTLLLAAGLLFVYPHALFDAIGFVLLCVAVMMQVVRRRKAASVGA